MRQSKNGPQNGCALPRRLLIPSVRAAGMAIRRARLINKPISSLHHSFDTADFLLRLVCEIARSPQLAVPVPSHP